MESLERLQGLHADLVAFAETKLANIERLWQELEDTLDDFRNLLDKPPVTQSDRQSYNEGKISVGDQEYSVNDEFKHISRALATTLDLDELEASKILISDYGGDIAADLDFLAQSVGNFHERRDLVLQNLRLLFSASQNPEVGDSARDGFLDAIKYVLDTKGGVIANASQFTTKCLAAMKDIQTRHLGLTSQLQNKIAAGDLARPEYFAILEFQKNSLFKQHEALGCILTYLYRGDYTTQEDLRKLETAATEWNRLDLYLVHYLPAFSAAFTRFGSPEGTGALNHSQARSLNSVFGVVKHDRADSVIDPFLATLRLFWTAQHSGWLNPQTKENESEASDLSKQVKSALDEFALEFLLAVCSGLTTDPWRHPARQEMVDLLLSDGPTFTFDGDQQSHYFREVFMESLEEFSESWISHLPDTIRQLRNEEDEQRLLKITAMQQGSVFDPTNERMGPFHLESFLILVSFAFEDRPDASDQWWEEQESNLYGFLQWASKRQTVPRVGAFCEMLCSIADGFDGATAAHKFLLETTAPVPSSRTRRIPSINYEQIFAELELYSRRVHDKATTSHLANRKVLPSDMNESESPIMLSTYLRLLAHLCRHTSVARDFIYSDSTIDLPRTLLLLSAGPVPSYLRASIFAMLDALLTEKDVGRAHSMWRMIDEWASSGLDMSVSTFAKPSLPPSLTQTALQNTLGTLSLSADQYDAFVRLLCTLLLPTPSSSPESPVLAFPDNLGSTYRPSGIAPYIDFVCGQIFAKRIAEIQNESHALRCSYHCLDLIAVGLETFNESYIALLDRAMDKRDSSPSVVKAKLYAQLHPFARLMQWTLGSEMNGLLMKRIHASMTAIDTASPDSPISQCLQRSIDIVNLALDLQPTYFDLIQPLWRDTFQDKFVGIQSSMEDNIFAHPGLILDLCQYAATDETGLALRSLSLLQKLSGSAKLNNHFLNSKASRRQGERIVDMLGPNSTATLRAVSSTLVSKLQVSPRELEGGVESPGYLSKDGLLAFFNTCLETQPELANVAHVLLGFSRLGERLVLPDSFESGSSVFDAIIEIVRDYPHGDQSGYISWLVHIKAAAIQTLEQLWLSSVSNEITISELRRYRLLEALFGSQEGLNGSATFDGRVVVEPDFWLYTAADTLTEVLSFRSSIYQYCCQELQACASENLRNPLKQHLSTVLGKSADGSGKSFSHLNVFDLGDFLDIDLTVEVVMPECQYLNNIDFERYMTEATEDRPSIYDLAIIRELLQVHQQIIHDTAKSHSSSQVNLEEVDLEAEGIVDILTARNRLLLARQAWRDTLRLYADMLIAVIEYCPFEPASKVQFIIQTLQLVLPKLDSLIAAESTDTLELVRAADALMFALTATTSPTAGRTEGIITEKLFQLFRTCIDGILMANSDTNLRSTLYSVASQYLTRITNPSAITSTSISKSITNSMDTIRSSTPRVIQILSDDAEDGSDTCRLHALNLLGLLISLARNQSSPHILNTLVKANILEILIEPLKYIAQDFQTGPPSQIPYLLRLFEARTLLLLQISRTRAGATALIDAGLMSAIRDSLLFRADPDLGFSVPSSSSSSSASTSSSNEIASAQALQTYFSLLSPTLRLLLSTFTSRGADNAQTQSLTRDFLAEYRPNLVGIMKRYSGVNGGNLMEQKSRRNDTILRDCVRSYVGLCTLCGFVEWEDEVAFEGGTGGGYANGNGNGGGVKAGGGTWNGSKIGNGKGGFS